MRSNYETTIDLIKKNYSSYIQTLDGVEGIWDGARSNKKNFLPLDLEHKNLQERICFALGPKKVITQFSSESAQFISQETNTQSFRSDALFFNSTVGGKEVLSIFENKIITLSDEKKVQEAIAEAFRQASKNYLMNHLKNGELKVKIGQQVEDENFNLPAVSITVLAYNPSVYLQGLQKLAQYIDSSSKEQMTPLELLEQYGVYVKTVFLSPKDILSIYSMYDSGQTEPNYAKYLENTPRSSLIFPVITQIKGFVRSDIAQDDRNLCFQTRLKELEHIPQQNICTSSVINNTRDLSLEAIAEDYFCKIAKTCVDTYIKKQSNELADDRFLRLNFSNSKAREVLYNANQSVSHWKNKAVITPNSTIEDKLSSHALYVSTDISLVDGQHSSSAISAILYALNPNVDEEKAKAVVSIDLDLAKDQLKKIFKSSGLDFNQDRQQVYDFLKNLVVDVNVRGMVNIQAAQKMVKNQNDIRQQSSFERWMSESKVVTKKIADFINSLPTGGQIYLKTTKDASDMRAFSASRVMPEKFDFSYLVSFARIFQIDRKNASEKDYRIYLGLQVNEHNYHYAKMALDFYYQNDLATQELERFLNDPRAIIESVANMDSEYYVRSKKVLEKVLLKCKALKEKASEHEAQKIDSIISCVQMLTDVEEKKERSGRGSVAKSKEDNVAECEAYIEQCLEQLVRMSALHEDRLIACTNLALAVANSIKSVNQSVFKSKSVSKARQMLFRYSVILIKEHFDPVLAFKELADPDTAQKFVGRIVSILNKMHDKAVEQREDGSLVNSGYIDPQALTFGQGLPQRALEQLYTFRAKLGNLTECKDIVQLPTFKQKIKAK